MIESSYGVALINLPNNNTPLYSISRVPATLYAIGWTMVPIGSEALLRYTYSNSTRYSTGRTRQLLLATFLVYTLYKSVVAWRNWHTIHTIVNTNPMMSTMIKLVQKNSKTTNSSTPKLSLQYTTVFHHWWSLSTDRFTPTLQESSES